MRELFSRNNEIILQMFMKQGSTKMPDWEGGNEGWCLKAARERGAGRMLREVSLGRPQAALRKTRGLYLTV